MLSIMPQLITSLSLSRMANPSVHVTRGSTAEGRRGGSIGGLLAVQTVVVVVEGLAGDYGDGIGFEGTICWGGAGREGFG